ncbi:ABC transporter ATP-binding protein [Tessaracoccus caeni]|uniref:ABC transporter ATP-binding protein n=1 Tax=Tessaracoccus caeni TaxID=3031239 RepID=UPI0023DB2558|nr:ABC transporter ATP-binding protein [Tessaracoccus caeni]MDF1489656.1 ABC transporter ATP-binding protein [Tessaracoccus caeni]
MEALIEARDLSKSFRTRSADPVHAVVSIDLTVGTGELVAFLGPNGAGKTTAIDMILGLTTPTSGALSVCGMAPRQAVVASHVAAMLQSGGLLRDISVRETVEVIAAQYPAHLAVDDVLERAGIAELGKRKVAKCSGGEQQRLRFALSLLPNPDLLILDEPTTGMDVNARRAFWQSMRAESHRTVLFATHYLEEAQAFADRIVLMNRGRIIADGPTREIQALTNVRTVRFAHDDVASVSPRLTAMPSVTSVVANTHTITVETSDSDALLADVLAWGGHDIEVTAPSLEAAFMALTKETN